MNKFLSLLLCKFSNQSLKKSYGKFLMMLVLVLQAAASFAQTQPYYPPEAKEPKNQINVNGTWYFIANKVEVSYSYEDPTYNGKNGFELWKSDGTAAGTVKLKDLPLGQTDGQYEILPITLINANGTLFFTANNFIWGYDLWKSDGTPQGTVLVREVMLTGERNVRRELPLISVNNIVYFAAIEGDGSYEEHLWKTDGTAAGTVKLGSPNKDAYGYGAGIDNLIRVGNGVYFSTYHGNYGNELWKSNGTPEGTVMVKDIYPGPDQYNPNSSFPQNLTDVNGILYFTADDGSGRKLWKSDGTEAGTVPATATPPGQVPAKVWDKTFGGSNFNDFTTMIPTSDGGYLLGGNSNSGISLDKSQDNIGAYDYWIVKIDASGNKLWDRTFGGNQGDILSSIIQLSDGGYILGGTSNSNISGDKTQINKGETDYWIVKIDVNGNKLWDRTFGGDGNEGISTVIAALDGGYLLGGTSNSNISGDKTQASKGESDYWIVKIDSSGNKLWDRTYGGSAMENLSTIIQTVDNNYLIGGSSMSGATGDKSESNRSTCPDNLCPSDYWIIKIDLNGNKLWDKTFGSSGDGIAGRGSDNLAAITQNMDGSYLLGGYSSGYGGDKTEMSRGLGDFWIVKTDSNGEKLWDKTIGGSFEDELADILQTSDGGYILAGSSASNISGEKSEASRGEDDYWIVKIDNSGAKQWDKTFGGNTLDLLQKMVTNSNGEYLLGGISFSPASADKTADRKGESHYWIVKIGGDNNPLPPATQVNFQSEWPTPPQGWIKDYGLPFGEKTVADSTLTYGWKKRNNGQPINLSVGGSFPGNPGNGRHRPAPSDILLATLMHMQGNDVKNFRGIPIESYWEMAVANGDYQVTVSVGDGSVYTFTDPEYHSINVEGVSAINQFIPQGVQGSMSRFKQASVKVSVTDGYLTIDADGGTNTKINYAIIQPLAAGAPVAYAKQPEVVAATATKQTLKAYPNPFADKLTIALGKPGEKVSVTVVDAMGKAYYQSAQEVQTDGLSVDLSAAGLKTGIYFIKLQTADGKIKMVQVFKK